MHLSYSTSKYKGRVYKSYSIAESYRDKKTPRKRTIWPIGKLSDRQADQIRLILKVVQSQDEVVTRLKDVVVKDSKAYLDIALVNDLWDHWQLDQAFDTEVTKGDLPTHTMARILTINRCTDPCSHYSVPMWAHRTGLKDVIKVDLSGLNDDKIYYELDKIHLNKASIEKHLFKVTYEQEPESYGFVNYDLTTSYFVGYRCNLSAFGKGKAECHGRRQVLLGVMINDQGYPFKWDVFPGNTAEVKTLKRNIQACKSRFKLGDKNITIVFDRGIISDANADLVKDAKMKYISALDRSQIPASGIDMDPFKGLSTAKVNEDVTVPSGFRKYDDELYFRDGTVVGDKRFIVGFNPTLFKEDRSNRDEKIDFFRAYLRKENTALSHARKDRQLDATRARITHELNRLKIRKYYQTPELTPIEVDRTLKDNTVKKVRSFRAKVTMKTDTVASDKLLDGVCVFVSNHVERRGRGFAVRPQSIIKAYRDKTKIEDVFKNVKSFLKLRPFFVNTDQHVEAVYTICILGYFMNKYLANRRKEAGEKDYLNSKQLYAPFKDIDIATLEDSNTGRSIRKPVMLPEDTAKLLQRIGMAHVALGQQS
jgi:transposase